MTTLYLFPTSKEAEGLLSRRADLKSQVGFVGVGMAEAAASTARLIVEHRPRRVVLCGIAGACDECLRVGEVVEVVSDSVAELPARFALRYHSEPITCLPKVSSFTVSRTGASLPLCGDDALPSIEQMEGAAVAAVAKQLGVDFHHIRAISNYVSDDRSAWRIHEAVEALGEALKVEIENE